VPRYFNLHPHERHGFSDVLRWKLFGPKRHLDQFSPNVCRKDISIQGDAATWIGHSSFHLRLAGKIFLTDPIYSECCAPFRLKRLVRRVAPGLDWGRVSRPDAVFITHHHYDHLDRPTIRRLPIDTQYFVPRGLARWFEACGRKNVIELNWWQSTEFDGCQITCVPAQHFSSRTLWDRDRTLWCGWVIEAHGKKVYLAGDTGYCPVFQEIGEKLGPMDLSAIPIGAYEPRWFMKPMHVRPEESVQIHLDVHSKLSVACHWGTFCLTDEPMDEPPKRLQWELARRSMDSASFRVLDIGGVVPF
jgi:N-acyl-phosphatidylethanolamine-hydrolysing phospholipase D